jgi:hypothetical protein
MFSTVSTTADLNFEIYDAGTSLPLVVSNFWAGSNLAWVHVCGTISGSGVMKLYKNGEGSCSDLILLGGGQR